MAETSITSRGEKSVKNGKFIKKNKYDLTFIELNPAGKIITMTDLQAVSPTYLRKIIVGGVYTAEPAPKNRELVKGSSIIIKSISEEGWGFRIFCSPAGDNKEIEVLLTEIDCPLLFK